MFDVKRWLSDYGIPFWTFGKNVSEGWVTVSCPFCGDRSNHGGFPPTGLGYSCFKCGSHPLTAAIATLSEASPQKARSILAEYSSNLLIPEENDRAKNRSTKVEWPPEYVEDILPSIHSEYLAGRGYDPKHLQELYKIRAVYQMGFFKYRLVIPVYFNGRVVTCVGRDVTGKSVLPYKNLPETQSIYPAKECVYNIDNVHKTAIITEGIFDAWRFRHNAVCLFGLVYTQKQVALLGSKLDKAFVCFDNEPDATEKAYQLAEALSYQGVDTEVLLIDKADPGELSPKEAEEIKKEIFGS